MNRKIKMLIQWILETLLKPFIYWLKENYYALLIGLVVFVSFVIFKTCSDLKTVRLNEKQVHLWDKKIESNSESDAAIIKELHKLRENEVIIIYSLENAKITVERIPSVDLQFYADSIYNNR